MRELAATVAKVLGADPKIRFLDARKEVVHAFSSSDALQRVFGPQDYVPLEKGVQRMAAWAKEHGARTTKPFAGIEVLKNLPSSWRSEPRG